MVEDKTRSQQTSLWSWGYQWRIYMLRCKPDLLQSTGSLTLCVLGKWVALCSRSACVSDTDPFLAEWAAKQQCGRQLHETWLGTREALGRRQWLGEQYCRLAGEGSRSKAEASIGPHPLSMLRSSSGNAVHLSLVVMCQLQTRKGYSRETCCRVVVGGSLLPDPAYNLHLFITFLKTGMCQCELVTATAATCYYLKCMSVPIA